MPDLTSTTVSTMTLKVPILLDDGSKITYNIADPKTGLSKDDIVDAESTSGFGGYLVDENLVNKSGLAAVDTGDPYYYNTEKIIFD